MELTPKITFEAEVKITRFNTMHSAMRMVMRKALLKHFGENHKGKHEVRVSLKSLTFSVDNVEETEEAVATFIVEVMK